MDRGLASAERVGQREEQWLMVASCCKGCRLEVWPGERLKGEGSVHVEAQVAGESNVKAGLVALPNKSASLLT